MSECFETDSNLELRVEPAVELAAEKVELPRAVESSVSDYLVAVQDQEVTNLYDIVLQEMEAPLLEVVMKQVSFNQSRAARVLGLNRGTLRKKLKRYDLL